MLSLELMAMPVKLFPEGQAVMKTDDTALFNAIFEFKRE